MFLELLKQSLISMKSYGKGELKVVKFMLKICAKEVKKFEIFSFFAYPIKGKINL